MERKKMHKRKGQWITISTSLIASMMVGASSQTIAAAQEDVAYFPEDSWSVEETTLTDENSVEVVEAQVYTEEFTNDSPEEASYYIEETVIEESVAVEATEPAVVEAASDVEVEIIEEAAATDSAIVEELIEIEEVAPVGVEQLVDYELDPLSELPVEADPVADVVESVKTTPEPPLEEIDEAEPVAEMVEEFVDNPEVAIPSDEAELESPIDLPDVAEVEAEVASETEEIELEKDAETASEASEDSEFGEVLVEDSMVEETEELLDESIEVPLDVSPVVPGADFTIGETTEEYKEDVIVVEDEYVIEEDEFENEFPVDSEVVAEDDAFAEKEESLDDEEVFVEDDTIQEDDFVESEAPDEAVSNDGESNVVDVDGELVVPEEAGTPEESANPEEATTPAEPTNPADPTKPEKPTVTEPLADIENSLPSQTEATAKLEDSEASLTESHPETALASDRLQGLVTTSAMNDKPTYTINRGDTLWSLARRHQVSVAELKDWNSLSSDMIIANASLIVSNPNNSTSTSDEKRQQNAGNQTSGDTSSNITPANKPANTSQTKSYTISQGDTLWSISRRHNISLNELREWNNLSSNLIHANQQLVVSNPQGTPHAGEQAPNETEDKKPADTATDTTAEQTHTVARGEYLYAIARQYGVSVSQLSKWNNLTASSVIHPRDQIIISKPSTGDNQAPASSDNQLDNEANETEAVDSANKQAVIDWFQEREGQVTYSMANRMGPDSYDCSSAVFYALMAGGYLDEGTWPGTTESLYAMEGSLLTPISRDEVQAGDLFVAGYKGSSLGAGGHTGLALSNSSIIHANYSDNGISTTPIEGFTSYSGMPTYWYRLNEAFAKN